MHKKIIAAGKLLKLKAWRMTLKTNARHSVKANGTADIDNQCLWDVSNRE